MFGKSLVLDMINRSAESEADRRNFLRQAGLVGAGVVAAAAAGTAVAGSASAATPDGDLTPDQKLSDAAVLNFALNLEYLEAEFYSYAAYGHGLENTLTNGTGTKGGVTGGKRVPFKQRYVKQYAEEIANDEIAHVKFLRTALGASAVSRPAIDLKDSFTAAARAAGVITASQTFDPFANDLAFLVGAFIFEDVGVTAYKGGAPLINSNTFLEAAAGILAVEAYHAGIVRGALYDLGDAAIDIANKVSDARDSLDGSMDLDEGVTKGGKANIVPTDANSIAYSRTTRQVHRIAYLTDKPDVTKGGFFPAGTNNPGNPSLTVS
jgi:hypothetical protein